MLRYHRSKNDADQTGVLRQDELLPCCPSIGISEFKHMETLPEQLKGTLPTIEEIEAELASKDEAKPQ